MRGLPAMPLFMASNGFRTIIMFFPRSFINWVLKPTRRKLICRPIPKLFDFFPYYNKMEEWYWRANNKSKAIEAGRKAIEELKSK